MIEQIESIICVGEGVSPQEIHCKSRNGELKETRQIIMYFTRKMTKMSWAQIAGYFDLDHATAIHAERIISNFIKTDRIFKEKMKRHEIRLKTINIEKMSISAGMMLKTLEFESSRLEKKMTDLKIMVQEIKEVYDLINIDLGNSLINTEKL
jgi:hypothetical protein